MGHDATSAFRPLRPSDARGNGDRPAMILALIHPLVVILGVAWLFVAVLAWAWCRRQARADDRMRAAARRALDRCYGVPYDAELTDWERSGMRMLEDDGVVIHDLGGLRPHWHRSTGR